MSRERVRIALVCERCETRNYHTTKARRAEQKERLTLRKFCPTCNSHTNHRESR